MAIIYDLFTGKVLAIDPEENQQQNEVRYELNTLEEEEMVQEFLKQYGTVENLK